MATATARRQAWAADQRDALAAADLGGLLDAIRAARIIGRPSRDHRLSRPLHDGARPRTARGATPGRRVRRHGAAGPAVAGDHRRRDPRDDREQPAAAARERGADLTIFSPRASAMAPPRRRRAGEHGDWAARCNDLIKRVVDAVPRELRRRLPAAAVARRADRRTAIAELERCVDRAGLRRAATSTPTRPAATGRSPPLTDRYWYPFYEKMVELDVPAMIHVSASCNPNFHATGAHYLNADTTAFMQLLQGDLFSDFPTLRFVIPHGGGAVPYHWGRYRGPGRHAEAAAARRARDEQRVLRHLRLPPAGHRPAVRA